MYLSAISIGWFPSPRFVFLLFFYSSAFNYFGNQFFFCLLPSSMSLRFLSFLEIYEPVPRPPFHLPLPPLLRATRWDDLCDELGQIVFLPLAPSNLLVTRISSTSGSSTPPSASTTNVTTKSTKKWMSSPRLSFPGMDFCSSCDLLASFNVWTVAGCWATIKCGKMWWRIYSSKTAIIFNLVLSVVVRFRVVLFVKCLSILGAIMVWRTPSRLFSLDPIPLDDWICWCNKCKHGGHYKHLNQWFNVYKYKQCPVKNCNCYCNSN